MTAFPPIDRQREYTHLHHDSLVQQETRRNNATPVSPGDGANSRQNPSEGLLEGAETMKNLILDSEEAMKDLRCLVGFIDYYLKPTSNKFKDRSTQIVYFQDLWHLFKPGDYVLAKKGFQRVWKVLQATGGRPYLTADSTDSKAMKVNVEKVSAFTLDCYHIDFNGMRFGPAQLIFKIPSYDGLKEINSLEIFPIEFSFEQKEIIRTLSDRGREFLKCTQVRHQYYKGRSLVETPSGVKLGGHPEDIDSQVIVDFDRTLQQNPSWITNLDLTPPFRQHPCETLESTINANKEVCKIPNCCWNERIDQDYQWDRKAMDDFMSKEPLCRTSVLHLALTIISNPSSASIIAYIVCLLI